MGPCVDRVDYCSSSVSRWLSELDQHVEERAEQGIEESLVIMLVGNKCDLKNNREVSTEDGKKLAQKHNMLFMETSALDGTNVKEAFIQAVQGIWSNMRTLTILPRRNPSEKSEEEGGERHRREAC